MDGFSAKARLRIEAEAIVLAAMPHGEAGAIVRALTRDHGLQAGYVRGGRSRRLRPALGLGNTIQAEFRSRVDEQLAALTLEPVRSRAALMFDPLAAAALEWLTSALAAALPEGDAHPALYNGVLDLLDVMEAVPALDWAAGVPRFELLLLAELGFGIDLERCAGTGQSHDLAYVSPRARQAVSRIAGEPHAHRLLPLPRYLVGEGAPDWAGVRDALAVTLPFLAHDLLTGPRARPLSARDRFAALVARRAGV